MMRRLQLLLLPLMIASLAACSGKGIVKEPSDEEINAEAAKAYTEVKAKSKVSTNKDWTAMVQRVSDRIAKASGENFKWETILIESDEVNAWCMPGGKMAVYTGIMPVLKTEAALAAVMGHEVAHATRRHGKQQYAQSMNTNLAGMIAGGAVIVGGQLLCKSEMCKKVTTIGGAAGGLAATFFTMKFSRQDESEADKYGQMYMAKAGYEPAESIKLWERMGAANGGKKPPEFMSTHPSDTTRQHNLTSWLPENEALYQKAPNHYGLGEAIR